jgi:transcriptional regulator with XRE-family HTH domain
VSVIEDEIEDPTGYGKRVGDRLRAIRRQKGLSLQEVEATSQQEFKASVLGAYERGERAISVPRLQRLARFYAVPVDQLLPREDGEGTHLDVLDLTENGSTAREKAGSVTLDLARLRELDSPAASMLVRYAQMIQVQRQDFNGRMLTVRRDDLRAIACILDTTLDQVADKLDELGLFLAPVPS